MSPKLRANLDKGSPSGPKLSSEAHPREVSVIGPVPNTSLTYPHLQRTVCQAPGRAIIGDSQGSYFSLLFSLGWLHLALGPQSWSRLSHQSLSCCM